MSEVKLINILNIHLALLNFVFILDVNMEEVAGFSPFKLLISNIQKIILYETKSRFYLVGSNNTQTKFRVLKIDRTEPRELIVVDEKTEYSQKEIKELLCMIEGGNKTKLQKGSSGLNRTVSSFGIVGFVRFLEGYYILLITKRRRVATIGHHTVYKIEDTTMIYIPNDSVRYSHPDETRYVKMFQNVDLSSNFYFSYSYDLTHTLQYNMHPPIHLQDMGTSNKATRCDKKDDEVEETGIQTNPNECYGVRSKPNKKFAWNSYLLNLVEDCVHSDWLLYVTHGFIGHIYGRPVYVTVIARRSNRFAGTRFLKRGANRDGDVANEVETEQITMDSNGRYTGFVQMRGSIPSHWSQDISKMVPKPPIILDFGDPYCHTAGLHFNQLLRRYGSPIIVLNLVKKREKKRHESILNDVYTNTIEYLNQFIPEEHAIIHRSFDMARVNKAKEPEVMPALTKIAYKLVKKTGIFQSQDNFFCHKLRPHTRWVGMQGKKWNGFIKQTGVVRVNCVDCLDRTNTAQFALSKVALAFQFYVLGFLEKPELEFDTDAVRMLEELYEDHGDTLALQYGGSQLVHRIKTYRKTAPWTSQSRDIMQTLSRYYSNAFSDADKQNAINLFLGVFIPKENEPNIWELETDYYLHHAAAAGQLTCHRRSYTQWWEGPVLDRLPFAYEEAIKGSKEEMVEIVLRDKSYEKLDSYSDFYRPFELTVMSELFTFTLSHSVRDCMPHFTTDFSPFSVRVRPSKRKEEMGAGRTGSSNPSVTGQSSTSSSTSTSSSADSGDSSSSDTDSVSTITQEETLSESDEPYVSFESLFPSMKHTYGIELENPNEHDEAMYKRFTAIGRGMIPSEIQGKTAASKSLNLFQCSTLPLDSSNDVTPPTVKRESKEIYRAYAQKGKLGARTIPTADLAMYKRYVLTRFR